MAIKVSGTEIISNDLQIKNITHINEVPIADYLAAGVPTSVSEGAVTAHEGALSINTSQIPDLQAALDAITVDSINDLGDVVISTGVDGQFLRYNGAQWVNVTIADADIPETAVTQWEASLDIEWSQVQNAPAFLEDITAEELADLSNVDTTTNALGLNQILSWDGSNWVNRSFGDVDISQSMVTQHQAAIVLTLAQVTSSAVTQHQSSLSITQSQISDLPNYEIQDSTILKDADIGVNIQAYNSDYVADANYVATDENFTTADHAKLDLIADEADKYDGWTVSDGSNTDLVASADTLVFAAAGDATVALDPATNTVTFTATDTTYAAADFDHDTLSGYVANEHIDWTATSAGSIHPTNLPATALTSISTAADESAMLALSTAEGDVVIRSDESKTYMHNGGTAGTMADFTELAAPTNGVTTVDGASGAVTLDHDTLAGFEANEHIDWTVTQAQDIHADNFTVPVVTTSVDGLMSAADKTKMDDLGNPDWDLTSGYNEILNKPTTIAGYGITDAHHKIGHYSEQVERKTGQTNNFTLDALKPVHVITYDGSVAGTPLNLTTSTFDYATSPTTEQSDFVADADQMQTHTLIVDISSATASVPFNLSSLTGVYASALDADLDLSTDAISLHPTSVLAAGDPWGTHHMFTITVSQGSIVYVSQHSPFKTI